MPRLACVRRVFCSRFCLVLLERIEFFLLPTPNDEKRPRFVKRSTASARSSGHAHIFLLLFQMVLLARTEVQCRVSFSSYEQIRRGKGEELLRHDERHEIRRFRVCTGSAEKPPLARAKPLEEEEQALTYLERDKNVVVPTP